MSLQTRITALAQAIGADIKALYAGAGVATQTHAAAAKTTPLDSDELPLVDSAASNDLKKLTWAGVKSTVLAFIVTQANTWAAEQCFARVRELYFAASASAAFTVDIANGSLQSVTQTANCTYTFPSHAAGRQFTLLVTPSGAFTMTFPTSVRWDGGVAPSPPTSGKTITLSFISDGTYWLGFVGASAHARS